MASGYAGTAVQEKPRDATLNERLNKTAEGIQYQLDRIESVLGRVNGTPPTPTSPGRDVAQIRPTHPLGQVVDTLEAMHQRLANLATGIEAIA